MKNNKKLSKITHKPSAMSVTSLVILITYATILITALVWAFTFSFVDFENEIQYNIANGKSFLVLPSKISFDNLTAVSGAMKKTVPFGAGTRDVELVEMFANSILYGVGVAFFGTLAPCIMGYMTSKYRCWFNKVIDVIVIVTMVLPIVGALPSQLRISTSLQIYDTLYGLWIMAFGFANMYYLVFKAIFKSLPDALQEAAMVDGASDFRICVQIMMPLVRTTFSSVMLIMFVSAWNNYTTPLAFAPNKPTAAYGLHMLIHGTRTSEPTLKMTGAMLLMIPILVFFCLFNKKLLGELTVGSVKG